MKVGERVRFKVALDFDNTTRVEAGETGIIDRAYPDMFGWTVWVKLDRLHIDLITQGYPRNAVWFNDYTLPLEECCEVLDPEPTPAFATVAA